MDALWNDLRHACRAMGRHPGFTAVALLVLTLAVGSTAAVFAIVNAVLIRPLPYRDPSRLVAVSSTDQRNGTTRRIPTVSLDEVEAWRAASRSLESIGSFVFCALPVHVGSRAMYLVAIGADPELLTTLGVRPTIGRNLPGSGSTVQEPVVLITHRLWVDAFERDPHVVGRALTLDGSPAVVVGVLPPSFQVPRADASPFPDEPDIVLPVANLADAWGRSSRQWFAIGRVKAGQSRVTAQTELRTIASRLVDRTSDASGRSISVAPLSEETARGVRPALLLTLGLFTMLLLIACTNIVNLLLSRTAERQRELSVRQAVGATRWRLVRQMMTESACLTCLAGIAGVVVASIAAEGLAGLSPAHLPISGRVSIDGHVLGFTMGLCGLAAILAGTIPSIHGSRWTGPAMATTRSSSAPGLLRWQRTLMVAQIALGVGLLVAAGVLGRSLYRLSHVAPGFRTHGAVAIEVVFPRLRGEDTRRHYERILEAVRGTPGVVSAGWITNPPPATRVGVFLPCSVDRAEGPGQGICNNQTASEDYFSTALIPLVRGRDFTAADQPGTPAVAVVNEAFVRQFLPSVNPLGATVRSVLTGNRPVEIVGVVRDARDRGLNAKTVATIYRPYRQFALPYGGVVAHLDAPAEAVLPEIRRRLAEAEPEVPLRNLSTIESRLRRTLDAPRFYTMLAVAGASMAVLFVALGLFGLVSYVVSRRIPEIGVRMALGATPWDVQRGVLRDGLRMAAIGVLVGTGLALSGTRLLASLLFETRPTDPATVTAAIVLVVLITLAACYLPARRAAGLDPLTALRHDR